MAKLLTRWIKGTKHITAGPDVILTARSPEIAGRVHNILNRIDNFTWDDTDLPGIMEDLTNDLEGIKFALDNEV